jgi:hypothetical protein
MNFHISSPFQECLKLSFHKLMFHLDVKQLGLIQGLEFHSMLPLMLKCFHASRTLVRDDFLLEKLATIEAQLESDLFRLLLGTQ